MRLILHERHERDFPVQTSLKLAMFADVVFGAFQPAIQNTPNHQKRLSENSESRFKKNWKEQQRIKPDDLATGVCGLQIGNWGLAFVAEGNFFPSRAVRQQFAQ